MSGRMDEPGAGGILAGVVEPHDIRKSFHDDLDDITTRLVGMAAVVTETNPSPLITPRHFSVVPS